MWFLKNLNTEMSLSLTLKSKLPLNVRSTTIDCMYVTMEFNLNENELWWIEHQWICFCNFISNCMSSNNIGTLYTFYWHPSEDLQTSSTQRSTLFYMLFIIGNLNIINQFILWITSLCLTIISVNAKFLVLMNQIQSQVDLEMFFRFSRNT